MGPESEKETPPFLTIRLSGTGGQGLVLMGRLLAEACGIHDGLNVIQTKSYGPEARGGASRSTVTLGPGKLDDIGNNQAGILICLSQKACDKYFRDLIYHGLLIVDSTNVKVVPTNRAIEAPLTNLAVQQCNNSMCTNVVALGLLSGYTRVVTIDALKKAVESNVRTAFLEKNLHALDVGFKTGENLHQQAVTGKSADLHDYAYLRSWEPGQQVAS